MASAARSGWNTVDELQALKAYPFKPQIVILQYFTNDIAHAAQQHGIRISPSIPWPSGLLRVLITHSYLADQVYWRPFRWHLGGALKSFEEQIQACYANEAVWRDHERELRDFVEYTQREHMKLLVVIFSNAFQMEPYRPITAKVAQVFESSGAAVIDLTPLVADRDPMSLVCNMFNAHPNEAFSREIGQLLYEKLTWGSF